ncbi:CorA family divalent cation transporter [Beggiatoa leptomitoformis]|uniref:Magnesium transporter CorA n=1 Tax=Beggiatoa leptomitoformis TaxID=288004 RepID=A0A2N9YE96_9GAMM|nr:CorA family divalent cation transporter [Beggiatoa leptomitoformis]ALG68865.1 magnesium transporter CorA [Beggiatoa leptomitoformis]AUI68766.1 magnesium transporter CorA [Beggiatoa leptomitoformis]
MRRVVLKNNDFQWIDVVSPTNTELEAIGHEFAIHQTAIQDCLQPEHLPKQEDIKDVNFIIVRFFDEAAPATANNVRQLTRKIAIFLGKDFLITIHRLDLGFLDALREKWETPISNHPDIIVLILRDLLKGVIKSYEVPLTDGQEALEEFESTIFEGKSTINSVQKLYLLRRKMSIYQRMLYLLQDILIKLDSPFELHSPLLQDLREEIEGLCFVVDHTVESADNLLTLNLSLASYRTNEIMRVLTIFSVFFMPLTFIAGIYGMNFEYMPELHWHNGYYGVLGSFIGLTLIIYIWFRRNGFL